MAVRVQVSPLLPSLFTLLMPTLNKHATEEGYSKREGCKFGGTTVRQIKRKRKRALAKREAKMRVSPHSDQAARGFA